MLWSNSHLDQKVLLRVLMKGGHGSLGTKPGINGDLFLLPVAQAAVVRDADVLLQLRDLWGQSTGGRPSPGRGCTSPKVNGPSHRTAKHTLPFYSVISPREILFIPGQ